MKLTLPQNGKWMQSNRGDVFGSLWGTFNIDLSKKGSIRISPRTIVNVDNDDNAAFTTDPPVAFVRTDADATDRWWALWAGGCLAKTAGIDPTATFTPDGITNSPVTSIDYDYTDMVEFNGALIVAQSVGLARLSTTWDVGWWNSTLGQSALQSGATVKIPHPLHVSKNSRRLLIGDGNKVHAVDVNDNVETDVVLLPSRYKVIWIRSGNDRNWIGTWDTLGEKARVFEYTELRENYDNSYEIDSDMAMACVVKNGLPYVASRSGAILAFSGGGFEPVAYFPIYESPDEWKEAAENATYGYRLVHPNGMDIINGDIHILIRNATSSTIGADELETYERFPGGVWALDDSGLHHKYSLSQYETGDSITDYGVSLMYDEVGALLETEKESGVFLAGAEIRAGGSKGVHTAIFYLNNADDVAKRGFFILPKIHSSEITDVWQTLWVIFKQLENSTDEIIIKYRKVDDTSLPVVIDTATWTATTTLTTTDTDAANISVGDELWILTGLGAGAMPHVSVISESGGTYTITLDEAVSGGSSGVCRILVGNWTKLDSISTQSINNDKKDLTPDSEWIQIKVELRGTGRNPEIEKLVLTHYPSLMSEQ